SKTDKSVVGRSLFVDQRPTTNDQRQLMSRDSIVYSVCSFLLGLILGSLLIGPKLASRGVGPASAGPDGPKPVPTQSGDPMNTVRQHLASLKEAVARDPHNFDALVQLGNMYMDA